VCWLRGSAGGYRKDRGVSEEMLVIMNCMSARSGANRYTTGGVVSNEVALWYSRYRAIDYSIWEDEEEAAGIAAAMEADGEGVPVGVQFQDGRTIPAAEWEALEAARERRERWEERPAEKPRPKRKIQAPFGRGVIEIDASEPSWLGTPREDG